MAEIIPPRPVFSKKSGGAKKVCCLTFHNVHPSKKGFLSYSPRVLNLGFLSNDILPLAMVNMRPYVKKVIYNYHEVLPFTFKYDA